MEEEQKNIIGRKSIENYIILTIIRENDVNIRLLAKKMDKMYLSVWKKVRNLDSYGFIIYPIRKNEHLEITKKGINYVENFEKLLVGINGKE